MTAARHKQINGPRFFLTPAAFGAWLRKHSASRSELIVGFYKVGSGRPSMTWPQSVDEALCVGWIDGVRKRIDDEAYQIRFTPRTATSNWSAVNISRVEVLRSEGRMTPSGEAAFDRRIERKSRIYAYEQRAEPQLSEAEYENFARQHKAWSFWESTPPSYQRTMLHWVVGAKRRETRVRRLAKLITACSDGTRLLP